MRFYIKRHKNRYQYYNGISDNKFIIFHHANLEKKFLLKLVSKSFNNFRPQKNNYEGCLLVYFIYLRQIKTYKKQNLNHEISKHLQNFFHRFFSLSNKWMWANKND
ncbi:MAG: hypothetical protein CBC83_09555 [Flavobacteriales bacterium TMED123]|nr:MAG: hypothetical protein CBC83_09555 [Flavobacteriales bacterium TMED123]